MNLISFKILPVLQYLTKNELKELEINKQNYAIFSKIQHKRMSDPFKPAVMLSNKKMRRWSQPPSETMKAESSLF